MVRYWVIAPYHYDLPQAFKEAWKYDRENGVIAIGWNMGNLAELSVEEIQSRFRMEFSEELRSLHQVLKFWHGILPGDRIIARGGRRTIVGLGTVMGSAFYDPDKGIDRTGGLGIIPYEQFLPVRWENVSEHIFPQQIFGMQTVTQIRETSKHWPAVKDVLEDVWDIP